MRTLIPILLLFVLATNCYGQIGGDKVLHFVGGSLFGLAGAGIAKHATEGNRVWTFVGAVTGSAIAGVAKEAIDAGQRENGWDNEDLAATILGGITVGIAIDLFSKKDSRGRLRGRYSTFNFNPKQYPALRTTKLVVLEGKLQSLHTLGLSNYKLTAK
ncbi:hypothetical protein [Flagellimonas abyssi]|uniref:Glycine zipper 2TM domain-containing protein n=1 Tax=Flagellimonas abyssi TaxID=2864871 RepID=A0ABS7ETY8_9FLAO|nr:hypothetical protein [Allomuricauda abyssi]MBW8201066.1 hypothetical protein [Allomuricauda abyssi]|tara:strand:- start:27 stop:500 length:474 start_codon:yes stop_codon:yes gene_type:complete